jgi:hypothetical protein
VLLSEEKGGVPSNLTSGFAPPTEGARLVWIGDEDCRDTSTADILNHKPTLQVSNLHLHKKNTSNKQESRTLDPSNREMVVMAMTLR